MAQAFSHRLLTARYDFAPRAVRVGFVVDCDGFPLGVVTPSVHFMYIGSIWGRSSERHDLTLSQK